MDFTAYDSINTTIDKSKTWVNCKYKQIFSKEIRYDKYAEYKSRFNPITNSYEYYIIFEPNKDKDNFKIRVDELGRTRISATRIWSQINPDNKTNDFQIELQFVETISDCDIYRINI